MLKLNIVLIARICLDPVRIGPRYPWLVVSGCKWRLLGGGPLDVSTKLRSHVKAVETR